MVLQGSTPWIVVVLVVIFFVSGFLNWVGLTAHNNKGVTMINNESRSTTNTIKAVLSDMHTVGISTIAGAIPA